MSSELLLTEETAERLAMLHLKCGGDRLQIGLEFGIDRAVTSREMSQPIVVSAIGRLAAKMSSNSEYTLAEHRKQLARIRDLALKGEDPDFRAALAAEVSIGKAMGFYEPKLIEPPAAGQHSNLSTEELKNKIMAKIQGPVIEGTRILQEGDDDAAF